MLRRDGRSRRHAVEKLREDMQQCPFTPDISKSWPPPVASSSPSPARSSYSSSACGKPRVRPFSQRTVTPERATEFYEQQLAWREACMEHRGRLLEAQLSDELLEETRARQAQMPRQSVASVEREASPLSPTFGSPTRAPGILPRTVYDRQILWRRQRDSDLEELRRLQLEELRRPCLSPSPQPRCTSAPPAAAQRSSPHTPGITPRSSPRGTPCGTPRGTPHGTPHGTLRSTSLQAQRVRITAASASDESRATTGRSPHRSRPGEGTLSGASLVERLRAARMQPRPRSRSLESCRRTGPSKPRADTSDPAAAITERHGGALDPLDDDAVAHPSSSQSKPSVPRTSDITVALSSAVEALLQDPAATPPQKVNASVETPTMSQLGRPSAPQTEVPRLCTPQLVTPQGIAGSHGRQEVDELLHLLTGHS